MNALLGALLLLGLPSLARAQEQQKVPPIQLEGNDYILNFAEDPALPLLEFVKLAQEATQLHFTYDPPTGQLLNTAKVVLLGTKRIPKSEFYNFFQIQLFINDFVCLEVGPPQIRVILIQSLAQGGGQRGAGGGALGKNPIFVDPENLDDYRDQPATLIITVLNFKNIDSRQLQTQLRQLLVDNTGSQQIVPAGDRSLIMQGFGSYISSLAKLLDLVDRVSAQTAFQQPVFDLIPLEFAAAEDVADLLEQLLQAQQGQGSRRRRGPPRPARAGRRGPGRLGPPAGAGARVEDLGGRAHELAARHGPARGDAAHQGPRGAPGRRGDRARAQLPRLQPAERQGQGHRRRAGRVPLGRRAPLGPDHRRHRRAPAVRRRRRRGRWRRRQRAHLERGHRRPRRGLERAARGGQQDALPGGARAHPPARPAPGPGPDRERADRADRHGLPRHRDRVGARRRAGPGRLRRDGLRLLDHQPRDRHARPEGSYRRGGGRHPVGRRREPAAAPVGGA